MHPSHYGRMCPIETPEGPNIGLIGYLVVVRAHQPVRVHRDAVPQGRARVASPTRSSTSRPTTRTEYVIAQANAAVDEQGRFLDERVLVRAGRGEIAYVDRGRGRLHGRLAEADRLGRDRAHPVPRARRRQPRAHGRQHAAPGRPAPAGDRAVHRYRHRGPRRTRRGRRAARGRRRHGRRRRRRHGDRRLQDRRQASPHRLPKFRRSNQGTCINQKPVVGRGRRRARRATSSPTARRRTRASSRSARTCSSRSCRGRATTSRTRSSSPSDS